MIDREALERKLASIESNLTLLRHLASVTDAEFDGDVRNRCTSDMPALYANAASR